MVMATYNDKVKFYLKFTNKFLFSEIGCNKLLRIVNKNRNIRHRDPLREENALWRESKSHTKVLYIFIVQKESGLKRIFLLSHHAYCIQDYNFGYGMKRFHPTLHVNVLARKLRIQGKKVTDPCLQSTTTPA